MRKSILFLRPSIIRAGNALTIDEGGIVVFDVAFASFNLDMGLFLVLAIGFFFGKSSDRRSSHNFGNMSNALQKAFI